MGLGATEFVDPPIAVDRRHGVSHHVQGQSDRPWTCALRGTQQCAETLFEGPRRVEPV